MCKNTGQLSFDPTLKRSGKGHRLCNPFRTAPFFYPNPFDPNPHESNLNPIDPTRLLGLGLNIWVFFFFLLFLFYDR